MVSMILLDTNVNIQNKLCNNSSIQIPRIKRILQSTCKKRNRKSSFEKNINHGYSKRTKSC